MSKVEKKDTKASKLKKESDSKKKLTEDSDTGRSTPRNESKRQSKRKSFIDIPRKLMKYFFLPILTHLLTLFFFFIP